MGEGQLNFSNQEALSGSNSGEMQYSDSMGSLLAEFLWDDAHACTHTHTCSPPGPDTSHTHTCFHAHTKIVAAPNDENCATNDDSAESVEKKAKKRPLGNREAVRKYREKKKAHTGLLEDEVVKLRALNQELWKRLHKQAALEAEVARLKLLLVDIRGRIEGEIGAFPYQKPIHNHCVNPCNVINPCNVTCNLPCNNQIYCPRSITEGINEEGFPYQKPIQNGVNPNLPGPYDVNPCNAPCNDQIYCPRSRTEGINGEGLAFDDHGISGCDLRNLNSFGNLSSGLGEISPCGMRNFPSPLMHP